MRWIRLEVIHMSGLMWSSRLLYMCTWLIICLEMGSCFSGKEKVKKFLHSLNSDILYALNSLWQDQPVPCVRPFGKIVTSPLYALCDYFAVTLFYSVRWIPPDEWRMTILWNFPEPDKSAPPSLAAEESFLDKHLRGPMKHTAVDFHMFLRWSSIIIWPTN